MPNLIAYVPVLNQRHLDWFNKHPHSNLFLISQELAQKLIPRLERNMVAIPTLVMREILDLMIKKGNLELRAVEILDLNQLPIERWHKGFVLPDEDVSHALVEKIPVFYRRIASLFTFEQIWARWDMRAVHAVQPVLPDLEVSLSAVDILRIQTLDKEALKSPDWWRQISAGLWTDDGVSVVAHNTHMPNEYETYIFGDPRLNVDAGQKGVYCSLHAERAIISLCAKEGISTRGASLYVTTFPCEDCAREISFAGFSKVFFKEGYSVLNALEVLKSRGVQIIQVKDPSQP